MNYTQEQMEAMNRYPPFSSRISITADWGHILGPIASNQTVNDKVSEDFLQSLSVANQCHTHR